MKKILAVVLCLSMLFALTACGSDDDSSKSGDDDSNVSSSDDKDTSKSNSDDKDSSDEKLKIGISIDQLFESRIATVMGLEKAGEVAGVEMVELVADGDAQVQNNQINTLLGMGIDGLLVCPVDLNTIETALMAADAQGVPVVLYDRDSPDSEYCLSVSECGATDDGYQGGKYIAEELAKLGDGPFKIAEIRGPLNDDIGNQRHDGFNQAVEEVLGDKAEVVEVACGAWDSQTALANLQSAYQANPDFAAIFCGTDTFFPVCETVLTDLNKMNLIGEEEHVIITGINGSLDAYTAVVDKKCDGTVVMNCGKTGEAAMNNLLGYINDGTVPERVDIIPSSFYNYEDIEANADNIWGLWDLHLSYQQ